MPHVAFSGSQLAETGTTQTHRLGTLAIRENLTDDRGEELWIYVFNDEAATAFAAGNVIARDAATATADGILAAVDTPANRLLGVAQHAIAAGSYGWIIRHGIGLVLADANTIDVNEGVYVSDTTAGTGMEQGIAVTASNTTVTEAHLAGPFAWATADVASTATGVCMIDCRG